MTIAEADPEPGDACRTTRSTNLNSLAAEPNRQRPQPISIVGLTQ